MRKAAPERVWTIAASRNTNRKSTGFTYSLIGNSLIMFAGIGVLVRSLRLTRTSSAIEMQRATLAL